MSDQRMRKGWNPKRLGIKQSENDPHETNVWLYLSETGVLDIVIQLNENGLSKGTMTYQVRLPS